MIPMERFSNLNVEIELVIASIDDAPRNGNDYIIDLTDAVVRNVQG